MNLYEHLSCGCCRRHDDHVILQWRHNERNCVSNHRRLDSLLLSRLFKRRWKKTSKLRVTGVCEGNSPMTGEFPAQRASNGENVSIWWRHHGRDRNVSQEHNVVYVSSRLILWTGIIMSFKHIGASGHQCSLYCNELTHWLWNKMVRIWETVFSISSFVWK